MIVYSNSFMATLNARSYFRGLSSERGDSNFAETPSTGISNARFRRGDASTELSTFQATDHGPVNIDLNDPGIKVFKERVVKTDFP